MASDLISPAKLLPDIVAAVEAASAEILTIYRSGFTVRTKADASPVTEADEAAERIILPLLAALLPGVPAISEVLPGYEVLGWNGIVAPAGTPSQVIDLLHAEIVKSLKLPDMVSLFDKNGVDTVGNTPQQFAAIIKADIEKWARVLKDAGIKPE